MLTGPLPAPCSPLCPVRAPGDGTLESSANGGQPWTPLAHSAVPQREADLLHFFAKVAQSQGAAKSAALRELDAEVSKRAALDRAMHAAVESLVTRTNALSLLQVGASVLAWACEMAIQPARL